MHLSPLTGIETNWDLVYIIPPTMHLSPLTGIETTIEDDGFDGFGGCIFHPLRGLKHRICV